MADNDPTVHLDLLSLTTSCQLVKDITKDMATIHRYTGFDPRVT